MKNLYHKFIKYLYFKSFTSPVAGSTREKVDTVNVHRSIFIPRYELLSLTKSKQDELIRQYVVKSFQEIMMEMIQSGAVEILQVDHPSSATDIKVTTRIKAIIL